MQRTTLLLGTALCALATQVQAQDDMACKGEVPALNVIGQGMPAVTALDGRLAEFNAKWDTEVRITMLGEDILARRIAGAVSREVGQARFSVADLLVVIDGDFHRRLDPLFDRLPVQDDLAAAHGDPVAR